MSANAVLARVGTGFADPTHGAQQTFRTLLDALSRPGRLQSLPGTATAGLAPTDADAAPPVGTGMAATLLTLLDADTPVLLAGAFADERTRAWIRFHTSARPAPSAAGASFAAGLARDFGPALCESLALGSDAAPQDGATLVIEVDALSDLPGAEPAGGVALTLRGPGIASTQPLAVGGLPAGFWAWREALRAVLPRGVDLVLIQGTTLAAIPRSSRLERRA